jgi:hypothetical protein
VGLLRRPAFLAAAATSTIVALYFALVAGRALMFISTDDPVVRVLGAALLVLPALGVWWLIHEWRTGTTVQRMANELERDGRLPIHDGETDARGKLTPAAQESVFEVARRNVDAHPDDWAAWFHVAYAYEASGDRSMARKSLRHASDLYRRAKREARDSA